MSVVAVIHNIVYYCNYAAKKLLHESKWNKVSEVKWANGTKNGLQWYATRYIMGWKLNIFEISYSEAYLVADIWLD